MSVQPEGELPASVAAAAEDTVSGFCRDTLDVGKLLREVVFVRCDVSHGSVVAGDND